jgi:hypothetical protein
MVQSMEIKKIIHFSLSQLNTKRMFYFITVGKTMKITQKELIKIIGSAAL